MSLYGASDEETLRVRRLLADWAAIGFLNNAQHARMEADADCGLRRTNTALRLVLFLFSLGSTAAAVSLFFALFLSGQNGSGSEFVLTLFAAASYAGAEYTAGRLRLYRHGIEEALAVLSVVFSCLALESAVFGGYPVHAGAAGSLIPGAGAMLSFFIYRRFGFSYAFLAAMVFTAFLPRHWIVSPEGQRLALAGAYAAALSIVAGCGGSASTTPGMKTIPFLNRSCGRDFTSR